MELTEKRWSGQNSEACELELLHASNDYLLPPPPSLSCCIYFQSIICKSRTFFLIPLIKGNRRGAQERSPFYFWYFCVPSPQGRREFTLSRWGRGGGGLRDDVGEGEGLRKGRPWKSHKTHKIQFKIENTEYRMQNTEYRIQNSEFRIQNTHAAKLIH